MPELNPIKLLQSLFRQDKAITNVRENGRFTGQLINSTDPSRTQAIKDALMATGFNEQSFEVTNKGILIKPEAMEAMDFVLKTRLDKHGQPVGKANDIRPEIARKAINSMNGDPQASKSGDVMGRINSLLDDGAQATPLEDYKKQVEYRVAAGQEKATKKAFETLDPGDTLGLKKQYDQLKQQYDGLDRNNEAAVEKYRQDLDQYGDKIKREVNLRGNNNVNPDDVPAVNKVRDAAKRALSELGIKPESVDRRVAKAATAEPGKYQLQDGLDLELTPKQPPSPAAEPAKPAKTPAKLGSDNSPQPQPPDDPRLRIAKALAGNPTNLPEPVNISPRTITPGKPNALEVGMEIQVGGKLSNTTLTIAKIDGPKVTLVSTEPEITKDPTIRGNKQQTFEFDLSQKPATVGRAEGSDVTFDKENRLVARENAILSLDADGKPAYTQIKKDPGKVQNTETTTKLSGEELARRIEPEAERIARYNAEEEQQALKRQAEEAAKQKSAAEQEAARRAKLIPNERKMENLQRQIDSLKEIEGYAVLDGSPGQDLMNNKMDEAAKRRAALEEELKALQKVEAQKKPGQARRRGQSPDENPGQRNKSGLASSRSSAGVGIDADGRIFTEPLPPDASLLSKTPVEPSPGKVTPQVEPTPNVAGGNKTVAQNTGTPEPAITTKSPPQNAPVPETIRTPTQRTTNIETKGPSGTEKAMGAASIVGGGNRILKGIEEDKPAQVVLGTAEVGAGLAALKGIRGAGPAGVVVGVGAGGIEVYETYKDKGAMAAAEKGVGVGGDLATNIVTFGMAGQVFSVSMENDKKRQAEYKEFVARAQSGEMTGKEALERIKRFAGNEVSRKVDELAATTPGSIVVNSVKIYETFQDIDKLARMDAQRFLPKLPPVSTDPKVAPKIQDFSNLSGTQSQLVGVGLLKEEAKNDATALRQAIEARETQVMESSKVTIGGVTVGYALNDGQTADMRVLSAAKTELEQGYAPAYERNKEYKSAIERQEQRRQRSEVDSAIYADTKKDFQDMLAEMGGKRPAESTTKPEGLRIRPEIKGSIEEKMQAIDGELRVISGMKPPTMENRQEWIEDRARQFGIDIRDYGLQRVRDNPENQEKLRETLKSFADKGNLDVGMKRIYTFDPERKVARISGTATEIKALSEQLEKVGINTTPPGGEKPLYPPTEIIIPAEQLEAYLPNKKEAPKVLANKETKQTPADTLDELMRPTSKAGTPSTRLEVTTDDKPSVPYDKAMKAAAEQFLAGAGASKESKENNSNLPQVAQKQGPAPQR